MLTNGDYQTEAGSTVRISGNHAGVYDICLDWLEERACIESHPSVDIHSERLVWLCECHGDGGAQLMRRSP